MLNKEMVEFLLGLLKNPNVAVNAGGWKLAQQTLDTLEDELVRLTAPTATPPPNNTAA
jgi:hypothetical protein